MQFDTPRYNCPIMNECSEGRRFIPPGGERFDEKSKIYRFIYVVVEGRQSSAQVAREVRALLAPTTTPRRFAASFILSPPLRQPEPKWTMESCSVYQDIFNCGSTYLRHTAAVSGWKAKGLGLVSCLSCGIAPHKIRTRKN